MTFACARALRVCAMLALPASAFAQQAKSPTIFSPSSQVGTINLRAAVVLADYAVKSLPLLRVVALRTDKPDSVVAETDLNGRVVMTLRVGTYTMRAKTAQPVEGRQYAWAVRVVVSAKRTEALELTNSNASMSDSVATPTVVADAPAPPPAQPVKTADKAVAAAKPVTQKPAQPVGPTNKVVASAEPPKQAAPSPAQPPVSKPVQASTPAPETSTSDPGSPAGK